MSTSFIEVSLKNLSPGNIYSVTEQTGQKLRIANQSNRSVSIRIEVVKPKDSDLIPGYEVIPDTSWITIDQTEFNINPRETIETDIKIRVPKDNRLWGKKYQTRLWSYTLLPRGGVGVGLISRIYFAISAYKPQWWEKLLWQLFPKK